MLTTDGINFSAKSAKESGLVLALILLEKEEINKINQRIKEYLWKQ